MAIGIMGMGDREPFGKLLGALRARGLKYKLSFGGWQNPETGRTHLERSVLFEVPDLRTGFDVGLQINTHHDLHQHSMAIMEGSLDDLDRLHAGRPVSRKASIVPFDGDSIMQFNALEVRRTTTAFAEGWTKLPGRQAFFAFRAI